MNKLNLSEYSVSDLLSTHSSVINELRQRNIIRSYNNPTGDYVEWLVSQQLNLKLETNSAKGFDAVDSKRKRYQIKGRRITSENKSVQLGVIRNLKKKEFDFLIAVILNADWEVWYAAKIPHKRIFSLATFRPYINGHIMHLRPSVFNNPDIINITGKLSY